MNEPEIKHQVITLSDGSLRFRSQPVHPVTGKRLNVTAKTLTELAAKLERISRVKSDLQFGGDPLEAESQLAPAKGIRLNVAYVWGRYFQQLKPGSRHLGENNWDRRLAPYFAERAIYDLTPEVMAEWERQRKAAGDAPKTIKTAYDMLAGAYRQAIGRGELRALPWGDMPKPRGTGWRPEKAEVRNRRGAATSIEQMLAIVKSAREYDLTFWRSGRYSDRQNLLIVMFLTGMRQAEAAGLAWDCVFIDQKPAMIEIRYQAPRGWEKLDSTRPKCPTKGRKILRQVLHPQAAQALWAQRAELMRRGWFRENGPVFPSAQRAGQWRTTGWVIRPEKLRKLASDAGIKNAHLWVTHSTRHSFCTLEVIASRGNLKAVQERTGHSSIKMLDGYLHAAGLVQPESHLPELEIATGVAIDASGEEIVCELEDGSPANPPRSEIVLAERDPWGITQERLPMPPRIEDATLVAGYEHEQEKKRRRKLVEEQSRLNFGELAKLYLAQAEQCDPTRSGRPAAVTEAAKRAYYNAYHRAERAKSAKWEAREAGKRARAACLSAWTAALRKALKNMALAARAPELAEGADVAAMLAAQGEWSE